MDLTRLCVRNSHLLDIISGTTLIEMRSPCIFTGVLGFICAMYIFVWHGLFAAPVPWKELDPTKPGFKIEKFRVTDYHCFQSSTNNTPSLHDVLDHIFPRGTSKDYVDSIVGVKGFQLWYPDKTKKIFSYRDQNYFRTKLQNIITLNGDSYYCYFTFAYDQDLKLLKRIRNADIINFNDSGRKDVIDFQS